MIHLSGKNLATTTRLQILGIGGSRLMATHTAQFRRGRVPVAQFQLNVVDADDAVLNRPGDQRGFGGGGPSHRGVLGPHSL